MFFLDNNIKKGYNCVKDKKKRKTMVDYKKMYLQMYNAITDAIEILKEAQIKAEEEFIESEDKPIELSEFLNKKK